MSLMSKAIRHLVTHGVRPVPPRLPQRPYEYSRSDMIPTDYVPPSNIDLEAASLTEIADHFQTDKGSLKHNFTAIYEMYLNPLRDKPNLVIGEIGVASGASLKMWEAYFRSAKIIGMDVNPLCLRVCQNEPDIEVRIVDTRQRPQPEQFDVMIDDGSHISMDIVDNFECNWPSIKPGGYYFIEDTKCTHNFRHAAGLIYRGLMNPARLHRAFRRHFMRFMDRNLRDMDCGRSNWAYCHVYRELCVIRKA
jgi:hypothetical protein